MEILKLNCWNILGIKPTNNLNEIKKAYAEKVKLSHPEENPEGFKELHKAYRHANKLAGMISATSNIQHEEKKKTDESDSQTTDDSQNDAATPAVIEKEKNDLNPKSESTDQNDFSTLDKTTSRQPFQENENPQNELDFDNITPSKPSKSHYNLMMQKAHTLFNSKQRNKVLVWKNLFKSYEFLQAEKQTQFRKEFTDYFVDYRELMKPAVWLKNFAPLFRRWSQECQREETELIRLFKFSALYTTKCRRRKNFSRVLSGAYILFIFYAFVLRSVPPTNKKPFAKFTQEINSFIQWEKDSHFLQFMTTSFEAEFQDDIYQECVTALLADDFLRLYLETSIEQGLSFTQLPTDDIFIEVREAVRAQYQENYPQFSDEIEQYCRQNLDIILDYLSPGLYGMFSKEFSAANHSNDRSARESDIKKWHTLLNGYNPFEKRMIEERIVPYIIQRIKSNEPFDHICELILTQESNYEELQNLFSAATDDIDSTLLTALDQYNHINTFVLSEATIADII